MPHIVELPEDGQWTKEDIKGYLASHISMSQRCISCLWQKIQTNACFALNKNQVSLTSLGRQLKQALNKYAEGKNAAEGKAAAKGEEGEVAGTEGTEDQSLNQSIAQLLSNPTFLPYGDYDKLQFSESPAHVPNQGCSNG